MCSGIRQLYRPEFIQLEDISETKEELHQHIDLIYLAKPETHEIKISSESEDVRWFSLDEIEELDMPPDVKYQAKRFLRNSNSHRYACG